MSESTRFDLSARNFRAAIQFTISPRTISDPYGASRTPISLSTRPSSEVRKFHFRDTAVYNLAVRSPNIEQAFEVVWKTWYPRRNPGMDRNPDSFFCRTLRPRGGVRDDMELTEVTGFHEELVQVADADEEERKKIKEQGGPETKGKKAMRLEGGLEDTFRKAIVVLDKEDWEKDGVLVVCRKESLAEFGLGEYTEGEEDEGKEGCGRLIDGGWVKFRKGLAEAVETVICDPERRKAEAPIDERYREKKFAI